jgi:hypothetical protein
MTPPMSRSGKVAVAAIVLAGIALLASILWVGRDRRPEPGSPATAPAPQVPATAAPKLAPSRTVGDAVPTPSPVSPTAGAALQPAQSDAAPRPPVRGLRALVGMLKPVVDGGGQR